MGQILVRKINDEALARLRKLAEERNVPLEAYARQALEEFSRKLTNEEMRVALADLERLRAKFPKTDRNSTDTLRALRDGDDADD